MTNTMAQSYLNELNAKRSATRLASNRLRIHLFSSKPRYKSMELGHLVVLVAEIPLWIRQMVAE